MMKNKQYISTYYILTFERGKEITSPFSFAPKEPRPGHPFFPRTAMYILHDFGLHYTLHIFMKQKIKLVPTSKDLLVL
jgi:hypothetical protein